MPGLTSNAGRRGISRGRSELVADTAHHPCPPRHTDRDIGTDFSRRFVECRCILRGVALRRARRRRAAAASADPPPTPDATGRCFSRMKRPERRIGETLLQPLRGRASQDCRHASRPSHARRLPLVRSAPALPAHQVPAARDQRWLRRQPDWTVDGTRPGAGSGHPV